MRLIVQRRESWDSIREINNTGGQTKAENKVKGQF